MSGTKSILAITAGAALAGGAARASVNARLALVSHPSGTPYSSNNGAPEPFTLNYAPTIEAGAAIDDPSLAGYDTYDLQAVVSSASGQDRWRSADLRAKLGAGQFYIPPGPVPTDSNRLQTPAIRNAVGQRFLQADTMVMCPLSNATRGEILGRSAFAPPSQIGWVFPSNGTNLLDLSGTAFEPANDMTLVDVAWIDPTAQVQATGSNGTFTVARLTVKAGSQGTFIGRVGSVLNPSGATSFTFVIGVIPEPSCAALLSLGVGALALRRRDPRC